MFIRRAPALSPPPPPPPAALHHLRLQLKACCASWLICKPIKCQFEALFLPACLPVFLVDVSNVSAKLFPSHSQRQSQCVVAVPRQLRLLLQSFTTKVSTLSRRDSTDAAAAAATAPPVPTGSTCSCSWSRSLHKFTAATPPSVATKCILMPSHWGVIEFVARFARAHAAYA